MNLTFLNSAFLFAASAAILPLVIHLISRRRVETVDFSSLRFLKELERRKIRRVRIRQILLLVVRTLAILALAVAAARPTLSGPAAGGAGRARTSVAIVLDTSASTLRGGEESTVFSSAAAAAAEIAGLMDEGDQGFLVTAGSPPESALEGGTFSRGILSGAVGELEPGFGATDYGGALELAESALSTSRNMNREIYVVGDLQQTGWRMTTGEPRRSSGSPPVALPRVYVVPVSGPVGNVGLVSAAATRKYGGSEGLYSVAADAINHGRMGGETQLRLFIDGVQVGQAGVELAPGAVGSASFAVVVDESTWHSGRVELPPDALAADNRCYFAIPPARREEVLIVGPDQEDEGGEAYYLEHALDPAGEGDRFRVSTVGASRLGNQEQGRFGAVILADPGRVSVEAERWLDAHVRSGGGLWVVLGGRTDVRSWNDGGIPGASLVRIRELCERPSGSRLVPSSYGHRLLDGLVFGERLVDEIVVRRSFAAEVNDAEEILDVPGIGPALAIVRPSDAPHGGEVSVLLTGLDASWSDLARSGFLVPLAHRLVDRLAGPAAGVGHAVVGEELSVEVDMARPGRVDVTLPDGRVVPAAVGHRRATIGWPHTHAPGIYAFSLDGATLALGAVNVDPKESDLTPASRRDIEEQLEGLDCAFIDPGVDIGGQVLAARRGRELWRVFVYVALALVALEMFLARPRVA